MKSGSAVHTTGNNEWRTPLWLYDRLNKQYCFGLDAAADETNNLCPAYFSIRENALAQSWKGYGNVFVNPPYSKKLNEQFVEKVVDELDGSFYIVMLLVSKTSVSWWHDFVMPLAESIGFVRGRLIFQGAATGAPFPSCVVTFKDTVDQRSHPPRIYTINQP